MRWDLVRGAFQDELVKIAEFNLMGLSAQQALGTPAPPMETTGLQQAMDILSRVERPAEKVAASKRSRSSQEMGSVEMPGVNQATGKGGAIGAQGRNAAWSTLGGASAGRLAVDAFHPHAAVGDAGKELLHHQRWKGLVGGAAVGAGMYAGRKLLQHHQAKRQVKAKVSSVGAVMSPKPRSKPRSKLQSQR